MKIFYWFNPINLLYERAIRINHEYLADNGVINENSDIKTYTDKLLSFISCSSNMSLTSGSNNSFTKLRLMMMMKSRSGSFKYGARIAVTLCMVTVFFLLLSFKESYQPISDPVKSDTSEELAQNTVRGIVLTEDGKPFFGVTITTTLSDNTSLETITDFDGRFAINDVQTGASIIAAYRGFREQTIKADFDSDMVIKMVRDRDYKGSIFINEIRNVNFRNSDFTPAKALLVIDGAVIDKKENFRVNPGDIKSFNVLTDKAATIKYGDKAKNGVVEIVTYGNKIETVSRKSSNNIPSDSSKYQTTFLVNNVSNKGELIDIPVNNLQYVSVWTYLDIDKVNKKEYRSIGIMTRDFFKVKGIVVNKKGKPLAGVSVSITDKPEKEISDKNGRFVIEAVRENGMLEFSLPGYKPYYLATGGAVYTMEYENRT